MSYFVTGGLELITPWPSKQEQHLNAEIYMVKDLQGYQLDFSQLPTKARFNGQSDCKFFGDDASAVQICISSENDDESALNAKFVHCPLELSSSSTCSTSTDWHSSTEWTTSLRPYVRCATTSFYRSNGTIVSISSATISEPPMANVSPQDLLDVFDASFNMTANSITGSSSALRFIQYLANVMAFAETSSTSYNAAAGYLRNLLALPLYYFHANNLVPTVSPSPDTPLPGLPDALYTRVSLTEVSYRIVVGRTTLILYIICASVLILACLTILVLGSLPTFAGGCPDISAWPTLDFVANCRSKDGEDTLHETFQACRGLEGRNLREKIGLRVITVRGRKNDGIDGTGFNSHDDT